MTDTNITHITESRHVIAIEGLDPALESGSRDEYVVYSDGDCITIEHDVYSVSIPVVIAEDVMNAMENIMENKDE